jgi:hypothetical protein
MIPILIDSGSNVNRRQPRRCVFQHGTNRYAFTGDSFGDLLLWKSTDSGATWIPLSGGPPSSGSINFDTAVIDANTIVLGFVALDQTVGVQVIHLDTDTFDTAITGGPTQYTAPFGPVDQGLYNFRDTLSFVSYDPTDGGYWVAYIDIALVNDPGIPTSGYMRPSICKVSAAGVWSAPIRMMADRDTDFENYLPAGLYCDATGLVHFIGLNIHCLSNGINTISRIYYQQLGGSSTPLASDMTTDASDLLTTSIAPRTVTGGVELLVGYPQGGLAGSGTVPAVLVRSVGGSWSTQTLPVTDVVNNDSNTPFCAPSLAVVGDTTFAAWQFIEGFPANIARTFYATYTAALGWSNPVLAYNDPGFQFFCVQISPLTSGVGAVLADANGGPVYYLEFGGVTPTVALSYCFGS